MKKLQNNFTTPEQAKRLLELGVPAISADCYFGSYPGHPDWAVIRQSEFDTEDDALFRLNEDIIPCWSVGRLIEIYEYCSGKKYERKSARLVREGNVSVMKELTIIEDVIGDIVNARLYIYPHMDFSKLEE